jgi:hypothetical protein
VAKAARPARAAAAVRPASGGDQARIPSLSPSHWPGPGGPAGVPAGAAVQPECRDNLGRNAPGPAQRGRSRTRKLLGDRDSDAGPRAGGVQVAISGSPPASRLSPPSPTAGRSPWHCHRHGPCSAAAAAAAGRGVAAASPAGYPICGSHGASHGHGTSGRGPPPSPASSPPRLFSDSGLLQHGRGGGRPDRPEAPGPFRARHHPKDKPC